MRPRPPDPAATRSKALLASHTLDRLTALNLESVNGTMRISPYIFSTGGFRRATFCTVLVAAWTLASPALPQEKMSTLEQARAAVARSDFDAAAKLAAEAIIANPKSVESHVVYATALDELGKHGEAVKTMDRAIELSPGNANMHDQRGSMRFKNGDMQGSLDDYDRAIKLDPRRNRRHWQRGIVCYYLGKYAEGGRQFGLYQTYDDNDVENVVWRFACMARDVGVEKARAKMLSVRLDRRVPMMQIYELFRGKAKPEDVLKAANANKDDKARQNYQQFYANYYLGLYLEATGKPELARAHLLEAPKHKNDHYMWHVARIHAARLAKPADSTKE